jgi:hypothetical protein
MTVVFIGAPTRREIELYLRNRRFSLMNNRELRRDILNGGRKKNKILLWRDFQRMRQVADRMLEPGRHMGECEAVQRAVGGHSALMAVLGNGASQGLLFILREDIPVLMEDAVGLCSGGEYKALANEETGSGPEEVMSRDILEFRYVRKSRPPGTKAEDVEMKSISNGLASGKKHPKVIQDMSFGERRKILGEKNANVPARPRGKVKKAAGSEGEPSTMGIKQLRKLVQRNTVVNTGYRYVRLTYRKKPTASCARNAQGRQHERKVTFGSEASRNIIHNDGVIVPILLSPRKPVLKQLPRSKELIQVQSLVDFSNKFIDGDFEYSITR